jgi:ABC-type branched-subunit amino acid transport system substrate-binding protein
MQAAFSPPSTARRRLLRGLAAASVLSAVPLRARAAAPIVLGHTYPASGVFAGTMPAMKNALDAAVLAINARGGIGGRDLRVMSLDDAYDPQQALANAETLRREHGAIALVAPVGTPVLEVLSRWAQRTGVPLIGARSGADMQRGYQREVFFNIASFGDEARYIARHLSTIGVTRAALAASANPTGQDIARRFATAAPEHGVAIETSISLAMFGGDAAAGADRLLRGSARTLLLAGVGDAAVELVRALLQRGWPAAGIYALSTQQPQNLHRLIGAPCNGMVFTQVVPGLQDARSPLVPQYRQALRALPGASASPIGLEAWISAQIAFLGLSRIDGSPTPAALLASLDRLGRFDIGGFGLQYDATSHHGTRYVDIGLLRDGRVVR